MTKPALKRWFRENYNGLVHSLRMSCDRKLAAILWLTPQGNFEQIYFDCSGEEPEMTGEADQRELIAIGAYRAAENLFAER